MSSSTLRSDAAVGRDCSFSIHEARSIVADLFAPRASVYWVDFLATLAVGNVAFVLCRRVIELSSPVFYLAFAVQCLAFYRASLFIHELVHLRPEKFKAFRAAWNLLCGVPFLTPSFVYYTHFDHHRRAHYGTEHDGEYITLGQRSRWAIPFYLAQALVIPLVVVFRFGILTPLAWISPPVRRFAIRHMSSLVMDPSYIRPAPTKRVMRIIRLQEALCFAYLATLAVLLATGRVPWTFVPHVYATAACIVMLNSIRTLGSHLWTGDGERMSFLDQLDDSANYPYRPWITELWGPLGLRYHALHHLFPTMPYHNMGQAHRRLMARLPADSPYRSTVRTTLCEALWELWRRPRPAEVRTREKQDARAASAGRWGRGMTPAG